MKREEAKVKKFDILHFVADNAGLSTFEAIEKAYNIGASEQKSILDKIRAEVEALEYLNIEDGSDGYDKYIEQYEVLKIIDKYRKEQKDADND